MSSAVAAEVLQMDDRDPNWSTLTVVPTHRDGPLRECVRAVVCTYLRNMEGQDVTGLHRLVMDEVERPMIETVLESANHNQSTAARILGISRSTLRKKLAAYCIADAAAPAYHESRA
jgi:Fis family transcriptional regulator, factor for inversion stimulation protein